MSRWSTRRKESVFWMGNNVKGEKTLRGEISKGKDEAKKIDAPNKFSKFSSDSSSFPFHASFLFFLKSKVSLTEKRKEKWIIYQWEKKDTPFYSNTTSGTPSGSESLGLWVEGGVIFQEKACKFSRRLRRKWMTGSTTSTPIYGKRWAGCSPDRYRRKMISRGGKGGGKNDGGIFGTRRPSQWTLTNFYERPTCQMEGKKSKV